MPLTPSQQRAIDHDGRNLQIIACAGSGKTEVVACRVARLLDDGRATGLRPANIVAFTFTDKAAAELKERIVTRVRERLGDIHGLAELFVGTIHAFCLDLIKTEIPEYLKFGVLDDVRRTLFVDRSSQQSGLTTTTTLDGRPLKRYSDTRVYCQALDVVREDRIDGTAMSGCSLAAGAAKYVALLHDRRYLDYSAILDAAARVLERDAGVRERIASRVHHLVVDEYQDVNPVQERVVRAIYDLGARLCVVGDDDQTIYQWRGSDVRNIVEFTTRYPEVTTIRLEENFRSSPAIVEVARDFIAQNPTRLAKAMKAASTQRFEDGDLVLMGFESPEAEAAFVVDKVKSLVGLPLPHGDRTRGLAYSDIAVLLRSVANNGLPIVSAFKAAGIPHVVIGLNGLFTAPEAEAARTTFRWLADETAPSDAIVRTAWEDAALGIAPTGLDAAMRFLAETRRSLQDSENQRWSIYSIQRTFLGLVETLGIREETVPEGRGEVALYNLGKFSQVISDFEQIHFHSEPKQKYQTFAGFLEHQADGAYAEGGSDRQHAVPDAVRIMTVHQAKGMQWPAVFLPALIRNRFPAAKPKGRSVWHLLPEHAVENAGRYRGGIEDERRLFYVAMTRAQKFLFMSWAPVIGNPLYQRESEFVDWMRQTRQVRRHDVPLAGRTGRSTPEPLKAVSSVVLSFSDLKYFFECPYQFKLRVLYGFNPPIHEALGYGKSLHDCLAEVHQRALRGDLCTPECVPGLIDRHLHLPFAYPTLRETMAESGTRVIAEYLRARREDLARLEFSEKPIEIVLDDGVTVVGRIDLVRRTDQDETAIVDLKSSDVAQEESMTERQLHVYALGYRELTGRDANLVEIYELDSQTRKPRSIDDHFINEVKAEVATAASALRLSTFTPMPSPKRCRSCDLRGLCAHRSDL